MAYRSILTVLTDKSQYAQLDAAIAMAQHQDAHLEVFCLGVDHSQSGYYYAGASAYIFQESIDEAMGAAAILERSVRERLAAVHICWGVEAIAAQIGGLSALVASRARYADLVIHGLPYAADAAPNSEAVIEAALFEGSAPVLIAPPKPIEKFGRCVLIAWNNSPEALVAVRRALPLLQAADRVEVTVIDPSPSGPERTDPGGALARMLVRHGVKAEIAILARLQHDTGQMLSDRATEIGADMLVMGAYSHSRFRQAIIGGATRSMLEKARIPVFMAR